MSQDPTMSRFFPEGPVLQRTVTTEGPVLQSSPPVEGPALPNSVSPKTSHLPEEVQSTHPPVTTIEDSPTAVTSPSFERLRAKLNKDTASQSIQ
ncbi:hypothetical protein GEMRC1_001399 [Eukaryota sp. GEM-RC1]